MRKLDDGRGGAWDVVVGRESWGALFAIFVRREGEEVRQAALEAENAARASQELADMDEAELRALLERSEPKNSD